MNVIPESKNIVRFDRTNPDYQDLFHQILTFCYSEQLDNDGELDEFLSPSLNSISDPSSLKDIEIGCELICDTMAQGKKILIFGDYDVDGITSSSLLARFFEAIGFGNYFIFIPSRFKHGYGLSQKALEDIVAHNPHLVITVDNGIGSLEEVKYLKSHNIKTVITDHHEMVADGVPDCPVINPKQPDCNFPEKDITGVGVVYMLIIYLRRYLRKQGMWENRHSEPKISHYLDLVAIGTIADQAPLVNLNRIFVYYGLKHLSNFFRNECGYGYIKALLKAFPNMKYQCIDSEMVSFKLSPLINSAGRISDGSIAVGFITASTNENSYEKLAELMDLNNTRLEKQNEMLEVAERKADEQADLPGIVVYDESFHEGVTGIIAGRLASKYMKPCIAFAKIGKAGLLKGSSRSPAGGSILNILKGCNDILKNFGGHQAAAGCVIHEGCIDKFHKFFQRGALIESSNINTENPFIADVEITTDLLNPKFYSKYLFSLEPHGTGNPRPVFMIRDIVLGRPKLLLEKHMRWQISKNISAIYWNANFEEVTLRSNKYTIAFEIKPDHYQSRGSIQLVIKNLKKA